MQLSFFIVALIIHAFVYEVKRNYVSTSTSKNRTKFLFEL